MAGQPFIRRGVTVWLRPAYGTDHSADNASQAAGNAGYFAGRVSYFAGKASHFADIRRAFRTPEYDAMFEEGDPSKNLLIGFDCNANPLEILYNVIDENTVQVFHAMKCRAALIPLLK